MDDENVYGDLGPKRSQDITDINDEHANDSLEFQKSNYLTDNRHINHNKDLGAQQP